MGVVFLIPCLKCAARSGVRPRQSDGTLIWETESSGPSEPISDDAALAEADEFVRVEFSEFDFFDFFCTNEDLKF